MTTSRLLGTSLAASALVMTSLAAAPGAQSAPAAPAPTSSTAAPSPDQAASTADAFVRAKGNAKDLRKAPGDTLTRVKTHPGSLGTHFVEYQRTHAGVEVIGGEVVVGIDAKGAVAGETSGIDSPVSVQTTASVSASSARATSRGRLGVVTKTSRPELKILAVDDDPRLVWETVVEGRSSRGASKPSILTVHVDAQTGAYVDSWDLVSDAADDRGYYNGTVDISTTSTAMSDPTRGGTSCGGQNGATFTGTDSIWGTGGATNLETACVDAMYATQRLDDMLSGWLGRDGARGNGSNYPMRVGLTDVNAYWNGTFTNFGRTSDGQRQVTGMDVVAHEQGHGIFYTTPGGSSGDNETGGMNEATGDIFGALTEHYAGNPSDPADYLVGEKVNLGGSGPIRNMYNPAALGDPSCYSSAIKNTEVHAAAGPLNHWFYLAAEGSSPSGKPASPICTGGPSSVTGLGIQTAGKIFYNGLLAKTSYWTHPKARVATLNAAKTLYPNDCSKFATVKAAWDAVSVPAQTGEPTCGTTTPPPTTPTQCSEFSGTAYLASGASDSTNSFTAAAGAHAGCLDGPTGADFDLYLQRWTGSAWSTVARGETASPDEKVTYTGTAGTYRWLVTAYSGSGSSTLTWDQP